MSDLIPELNARPWSPASNVTEILILNEYNIPLAGLIEQDSATYLYSCIVGELEDLNIWAYAPISGAERERLSAVVGDELGQAMAALLEDRMLVVALADDCELRQWSTIDAGVEGPLAIAKRFLQNLRRQLAQTQESIRELEEQGALAGV